jgi:HAD superfamily hydrolase (TIGR01509 family)
MIKLAIFDMDGTVFENYLDWLRIRKELDIKQGGNILKEIYKDGCVDAARLELLEKYEADNTLTTKPIKGIAECLCYLETRKIKTALITNNNKRNTNLLLDKFNLRFDTVITREMRLWKPEPDAFFYVMDLHDCAAEEVIVIGDSHYDVKASRAANISDVFIIEKENRGVPIDDDGVIFFNDFYHFKKILESRFK